MFGVLNYLFNSLTFIINPNILLLPHREQEMNNAYMIVFVKPKGVPFEMRQCI